MSGTARRGVHVWSGRVRDTPAADDVAVLDERERHRFAEYRDALAAAHYAGARAAVRRTVARWHGVRPAEVVWGTGRCPGCGSDRHGPPLLRAPRGGWRVSVSRSGPWWMLALSRAAPVGVDIEQRRPLTVPAVVRRCLGAQERAHVAAAAQGAARDEELLRCWVRKEAVVKGWGIGLGTDLARVAVRPELRSAVLERTEDEGAAARELWVVQDVPAGEECLAALSRPADDTAPLVLRPPEAAAWQLAAP
ncbi:4'-phosphopantetheinyl transferase superfamily protein [Streptomyces tubbatahanensis]|uniref:4'-phosphopantetheinyl transferase superfamily protein n=1 Tax=Streptomyces tubbatahanensis TaxID=2923272 RepID=A0ABY3XX67_9ACTN|nr:4'-phosphopantetheinyl transferase superfamily protein [Streptomyces tubbatahanensis]UNS99117.1 4'-phosphopantetheinyl transferase superfamily protein [Streptomyces tubbatahanensis]